MKKVFLFAYDKQNLGDDLFIHTITARYPQAQFYLRSEKKNIQTFSCLPNLKVIAPAPPIARFLRRIRPSLAHRFLHWQENRCDASVYIGGSIFMEYPNWRHFSEWWDYQAQNRRFYVMGANFGPWHDPEYPQVMGDIFAKMEDVCFRERYSYELFHHVPTVRQAPDILLAYPMPRTTVKKKQIFVSVINCLGRDAAHSLSQHQENYIHGMTSLLRRYLDDGCSIILSSFCKEEGDEESASLLLDVLDRPGDPNIRTLHYDGTNAHALTEAIAESDYIIATRFHATVLAIAAGRPVLPILYSDKTKHLLQDLAFNGLCFDLRQKDNWDYTLSRHNWDHPQPPLSEKVRQDATSHFEKLDQLLNKL